MKLYHARGTCSLSPHIVLHEAGLPFQLVNVDLRTKKTEAGDDFLTINPKGQVPTLLLDDGSVLTEGAVIVQYLADRSVDVELAPAPGTMERVRLQEWLNYLASDVHKSFGVFYVPTASEPYKQSIRETIVRHFSYLDRRLATRPYLVGDNFTVADAYLFTILSWTSAPPRKLDLTPFEQLRAFQDRVATRRSVRWAMKHEPPPARN